ncbi:MAG: PP2C family protein-serine/threonine phosphatase [Bryobacteraceae bacterium]
MRKGFRDYWRGLGRVEKAFLILAPVYAGLHFAHASVALQVLAGLGAFLVGMACLFRLARYTMRKAIWRLRNRLIVAYAFIAVVPIVLILTLVGVVGWVVIGQMAVYLVNTELAHRESVLLRQAETLAHVPVRDPESAVNRFTMTIRSAFPAAQFRITGHQELRYPSDAALDEPPAEWKMASGLVIRPTAGGEQLLYAWAHVVSDTGNKVTVIAPISHELLASMVPGLGDINFMPLMGHVRQSHLPRPVNFADFPLSWVYPVDIPHWDSPQHHSQLLMVVNTRLSAVLGIVFGQKMDWGEVALTIFLAVSVVFLIVELVSLVAGIQLSRSITGAVHQMYEGTLHVRDGDFSYRVPVKGSDQLAELTSSFNNMTQHLGRLLVVAKEKERLESELAIAREVQDQLFPKDVPFTKTLELKGVCRPARMVSGDYYDFLALNDHSLAFAIGDVAGKGISAALLMATIQSTMRTQLSALNGNAMLPLSTSRMVATLNRQLYATTAPEKYATFYFAMYEETTHSLRYTNAGHLSPMLVSAGNVRMLGSTGTVVGAFPIARYEEKTVPLEHGDILVAYTDGVVEPENAYGEMFGEERLQDMLVKLAKADSSELIARVMEAVDQWTGGGELQDDMTMVVARRI